ncbi:uncharacterized protein EI97DRAFT_431862 [Westerdykella ornata]|uniref:Uncharacterized protein n=1 Tax=Westerdykella ornata TaxID=318751 RepID=A0A6A6JNG3_WESOR|nr:uncharacterized protein EI97DRAFT_431862 [Westerdykella ornata]KAF2277784.1 hypothetical protein EI97DRAFT_431862 [Westerdykella ornata]
MRGRRGLAVRLLACHRRTGSMHWVLEDKTRDRHCRVEVCMLGFGLPAQLIFKEDSRMNLLNAVCIRAEVVLGFRSSLAFGYDLALDACNASYPSLYLSRGYVSHRTIQTSSHPFNSKMLRFSPLRSYSAIPNLANRPPSYTQITSSPTTQSSPLNLKQPQ